MVANDPYLMIPGPVSVLPRVLRKMSSPMISHRGEEFEEIFSYCKEHIKPLFGTSADVMIINGSGTAGMEAVISNFLRPEDRVLNLVSGKFSERFEELTRRYATSVPLNVEWGTSFDMNAVEEAMEEVDAVTFVHNETSTGIMNPAPEIAKIAKKHDVLVIMDGITSIGGAEVLMDKWELDLVVTGSQKCLGCPPGLSAVAVSDRAWERLVEEEHRPYYVDMGAYKKSAEKNQTPYTPAVSLFIALQECLTVIEEEGLPERIERHGKASAAVRAAAEALGIELFPSITEPSMYSPTVTAMRIPEGITDSELRGGMRELGVYVSGGQGILKGKIFRIGTMGDFSYRELLGALGVMEAVLKRYGVIEHAGDGVGAALETLNL
ncbi:MAG: pyridoxal-phosphate-dependent aminotransferase family protein [Methermicoccaceae archaeon]